VEATLPVVVSGKNT